MKRQVKKTVHKGICMLLGYCRIYGIIFADSLCRPAPGFHRGTITGRQCASCGNVTGSCTDL